MFLKLYRLYTIYGSRYAVIVLPSIIYVTGIGENGSRCMITVLMSYNRVCGCASRQLDRG